MSKIKIDAARELFDMLEPGEAIESIVFGAWGWGSDGGEPAYNEPDPPPVPMAKRGDVLAWAEAEPYMHGWQFSGEHGAPDCYAVTVWTNRRVFWVQEYDGATGLTSAPRHPFPHWPRMS